jgi:hypothetical protein
MNVRFVNCFVAMIGLICVGANGDVTAMPADPPISPQAQSALNMAPFADELAKIGPEVDKLVRNAGDQPTVSMVRKWLVDQDPANATNPYQVAYAAALNQVFLNALAQPNTPITAKLNMGIVISSLAGPKANLAPTITKLLEDANPVVAYWGLKATEAMLPWALQDANFNNSDARGILLDAVVKAVSLHSDGKLAGPIAESAYNAINPKKQTWRGAAPTGAAFSALVDANLSLQQSRLAIYQTKGAPASPIADTYPTYLLLSNMGWPAMNLTQQLQAVQQAADFISLAGQRASVQAVNVNQDLIQALKEEGEWVSLLGQILSDVPIQQVGTVVRDITPGTPAATIVQDCSAVFPAIQNNPQFTSLRPPLTVGAPPGAAGAPPGAPGAPAAAPGPVAPKSASDNPPGSSSATSEARP